MRNLIIKKILSTLLNSEFITKHHINSYNQFVSEDIQNTFQKMNPIYIKNGYDENKKTYAYKNRIFIGGKDGSAYYFSVPTIHLPNKEPAQLTPNKARLNNLNYSCVLSADILVETTVAGQDDIDGLGGRPAFGRGFWPNCRLSASAAFEQVVNDHDKSVGLDRLRNVICLASDYFVHVLFGNNATKNDGG